MGRLLILLVPFWLIGEARPFGDYLEDVKWQAGNLRAVRRIAARHVHPHQHRPREMLEAWLLEPKGYLPDCVSMELESSLTSRNS